MNTWKSALTLTVAAALVATTAFAQSGGSATAPQKAPGASSAPSDAAKPDASSPSASPSDTKSDTMKSDTTKPDTMKSDTMKSDTMKSDTMAKPRGMAMSGGKVKAVQQALKDKGHDPGAIDGVMGPKTRSALKDFQKKEGIKDTGRLDQDTMSKLGVETKSSGADAGTGSASPSTTTPSTGSSTDSTTTEKK